MPSPDGAIHRFLRPFLLAILALPAGAASSPAGAQPAPEAPWSIDDVLLQESAGGFRFSPAGERVVWVRSGMHRERGRTASNLWLSRLADGESWPLTRGRDTNRSPRWSPDGRRLAFLSDRELEEGDGSEDGGGTNLWVLRVDGGEPWPVAAGLRGIRDFAWKGESSDTLIVAARERRSHFEGVREERDDDSWAVEDTLEAAPIRLWSVTVDGGSEPRRLTTDGDWIREVAVSPDGRRAATVAGVDLSYGYDARNPPRTWLVDLETGDRREILAEAREDRVVPSDVQWSPEGSGFYFEYEHASHPVYRTASVTRMAYFDVDAGALERIDLDWDRGLSQGYRAVPGGFVAMLADGVVDRPALYRRTDGGWGRTMLLGDHVPNLWGWSVSDGGDRIAYEHSTAVTPPQPYVARIRDARLVDTLRLAELNPSLADRPMPRARVISWRGARGDSVQGIVYYPFDYQEGRRYPLILNIHGGPASRDRDAWGQSWSDPLVLFLQRGAVVLQTNYHGSCCYGLEWVESIVGGTKYYDLPVADLEAGVDHLIERGLVHPDSVATQGWSNGAILSSALTVENPERYKVSSAGAGETEWIGDWGNTDFGAAFDNHYFGASPLEDRQLYLEVSPYWGLDRVRTPTLIFFGTEDRAVPPSQGWTQFRALQQLGHTDVRFVIFPGEPHGPRQLAHQRRKVEEELRWIDRYLWGEEPEVRTVVEEGSPLDGLLARSRAARTDGLYGVRRSGVLMPETVPADRIDASLEGFRVGRFEVTRAQWAAYDSSYAVPPGTRNHPAGGIGFGEARSYVRWLGRVTGDAYRLPTASEARRLAGSADGGITLGWWAGYTPNPEDEAELRQRLGDAGLGADGELLLPVGSYPGDAGGAAPRIFDLGGGVAEWARGEDDGGVPVGPSAASVEGRPAGAQPPPPAYRGLRVVREER